MTVEERVEALFERFKCKACGGAGRFGDDILCNDCKGQGHIITEEQHMLWKVLLSTIKNKTLKYQDRLLRKAEREFTKQYPKDEQCQPVSVGTMGTMKSVISGWLNFSRLFQTQTRLLQETTEPSDSNQKKHTHP